MNIPVPKKKICLNKGESKSISIACASIIAKVSRDRLMVELDKDFPQYGFAKHKGYGTRYHMEAIIKYGLSPAHRRSFGPFGTKEKELRT
jgi:ribonuclease HII